MARNLRDKIRTLVQDAYDLRQESVVTKIENLIKEELELRQEERDLTYQDLCFIQSAAAKEYTDMRLDQEALGRIHGDQAQIRTLCLVNAMVGFLRGKGFLHTVFKYKK